MPASNVTVTATFTAISSGGGGGGGAGTTGHALTIEALTAGTITVTSPKSGMQYSLNGAAKTAITEDMCEVVDGKKVFKITVAHGDKVEFYGTATSYNGTKFGGTAEVKVYGNIMSLLSEDFANTTTLPSTSTFAYLFEDFTNLKDASGLLLPATELTNYCYNRLFRGCTALTSVPELKATTLAEGCYSQMFFGCTSLASAPELKATTLAKSCYYGMFSGCTSLTSAPELKATTLVSSCYYSMFSGCTSLATAPELPATTLANQCCMSMFKNCTSLTSAPELKATELASMCYYEMFSGCSNLNSIKCLATNISASQCTVDWLKGVAASGTFTTASATNWKIDNVSGIPTGWTRKTPEGSTIITWTATDMAGLKIHFDSASSEGGGETVGNTIKGIKAQGDLDAGSQVEWMKDTNNKINITANTSFPISFTSSDTNTPINIKSIVITAESITLGSEPAFWTKTPTTLTWSGTAATSVALPLAAGTVINNISQIVFTLE